MVKYLAIYQKIKQRILDNEYSIDHKLPEGKKLALEFNCSELTIKKALDILVIEGFIVRKRGSGSYIKRPNDSSSDNLSGTRKYFEDKGKTVETQIIHFSATQASDTVVEKLGCTSDDLVYNIVRVRHLDGIPSVIEYAYLPTSIITGLKTQHLEDSLYTYIQKELKLKIHGSDIKIFITEADENEKEYLQLATNEQLGTIEKVGFLDNGQRFEYVIIKQLQSQFEFSTTHVKGM